MLERRGFFRSVAAITACGALPSPPAFGAGFHASEPEHQLEALYRRYLISMAAATAATDHACDLAETVRYPDPPAAAFLAPGDDALGLARFAVLPFADGRRGYCDCAALRHVSDMSAFWHRDEAGRKRAERATEILAALADHLQARMDACTAAGCNEADHAMDEARRNADADARALAAAQATTLRGLLLKAQAIATAEGDAESLGQWRQDLVDHNPDTSTALAVSLTLDLIRLSGSA